MDEHYYSKLETIQTLLLCEAEHLDMDEEYVCLMREAFISLVHVQNTRMWQVANGSVFMCEGRDEWGPIVGADGVHSINQIVDSMYWKYIGLPYYLERFIAIPLADTKNIMICGELIHPNNRHQRFDMQFARISTTQTDRQYCCFLFNIQTCATTRCLNTPFEFAQAAGVVLGDGSVFVCGGVLTSLRERNEDSAAIFRDGKWHMVPAPMRYRRRNHMCALMNDGRVLIFGGQDTPDGRTCEIFDPSTSRFSRACDLPFTTWHNAAIVTLPDGRVMACGGYHQNLKWRRGRMALIYDPAEDVWTITKEMKIKRVTECSLLLGADENSVLAVGGANSPYPALYYPAEIFDLATNEWSFAPSYRVPKNKSVVKHVEDTHTGQKYKTFFNGFYGGHK